MHEDAESETQQGKSRGKKNPQQKRIRGRTKGGGKQPVPAMSLRNHLPVCSRGQYAVARKIRQGGIGAQG
jgi:hypothetical protein